MNWNVYIVQCIVMMALFGVLVMGMLFVNPISFISDYPPEIQERYYKTQKKEKTKTTLTKIMIVKKVVAMIVFLLAFAWLAHKAGASTFKEGLIAIYGYVLVIACFDTVFMDWVLFANIKKIRLPGTEDMDREYHQKWFHVKAMFPMIPAFLLAGVIGAWLVTNLW